MNIIPQSRIAGSLMSVEVLKYAGFLLMMVDHTNQFLCSHQYPWMHQAGRLVFPLFAMVLGLGLRRGARPTLVFWLLGMGAVAQLALLPLISAGVRLPTLNVLYTLGAGVLLVHAVEFWRARRIVLSVGAIACAVAVSWWSEYGPPGALLVLAMWSGSAWAIGAALLVLSAMQLTVVPMLAPLFFLCAHWLCSEQRWRSPRMLFGWAYVAHFAVFAVVLAWMTPG